MRDLTSREQAVLNHVVENAGAWWADAQAHKDPEAALDKKCERWGDAYDAAVSLGDYKTRAEKEAEEAAKRSS